ncbi:fructokinase [Labrys miyagiensis]|uniref:Fructokinase n=1 Tax=Labrys miyagiensis TaxID=346912 RepID=A0ABQ6CJ68_9HYPH|nr:sugar kinase [Labrys miyagiensis]GLS18276.1 fructokinase [Labrys miyagiensis]
MRSPQAIAPESLGPTLTIGEILVEIMATSPGFGFNEPQTFAGPFPSGAPAIFIDQVARLGGSAAIVAAVGDDDFGKLNLARLRRDGVDVSAVTVEPNRPTGSAFVRYRPDGARDFIFNITHSAAGQLSLTTVTKAIAERAGHLHVMGSSLAIPGVATLIEFALAAVRKRGGSVSLDPNVRKELLADSSAYACFEALVQQADLLLPSGDELLTVSGRADRDDALSALFELGVSEIVLKRGAEGASYYRRDGSSGDAAAFRVTEIDPTGAGDCFGATYLTCRRLGMDPAKSLTMANAAGARTVTQRGPMEGVASLRELNTFVEGTPRS